MHNTMISNLKVVQHQEICKELNALYERKNHDYGDSFHESFLDEGLAMPRIRLGDKYSRFKTLSHQCVDRKVKDESIRDTLIDLANYAIMTIMELDEQRKSRQLERIDRSEQLEESPDRESSIFAFSPEGGGGGQRGIGEAAVHPHREIHADDILELYRGLLKSADGKTMSALDRVITAGYDDKQDISRIDGTNCGGFQ